MRKLVKQGSLNLQDTRTIKEFAEKFIVSEEMVISAVRRLYENNVTANLWNDEKKKNTKERKDKTFAHYDWK